MAVTIHPSTLTCKKCHITGCSLINHRDGICCICAGMSIGFQCLICSTIYLKDHPIHKKSAEILQFM